jgi:hypothetical protein
MASTVNFTSQITPQKKARGCYVRRTRRPWHITETDNKIVSVPLCPNRSKNAQFAICMGAGSGQYAGCAVRFCHTCLTQERACVQIGRRTQILRQYSRVCKLRMAEQLDFYTRQSLLHITVLPIDRLNLEMGHSVDSAHGEIRAVSLQWTPSE